MIKLRWYYSKEEPFDCLFHISTHLSSLLLMKLVYLYFSLNKEGLIDKLIPIWNEAFISNQHVLCVERMRIHIPCLSFTARQQCNLLTNSVKPLWIWILLLRVFGDNLIDYIKEINQQHVTHNRSPLPFESQRNAVQYRPVWGRVKANHP